MTRDRARARAETGPRHGPSDPILRPGGPFAIQIEITSHCNLRCKMCPLTTQTSSSAISPGHVEELVWTEMLRLAEMARQVFIAGFGEPLTNRRCVELLRQLDARGVLFTLVTNGLAINRVIAAELASMQNLAHINVSIDSPDPIVYRSIRGGNLDRALTGLTNLMAAVPEPRRVSVSSVALRENLPTLSAFPALLSELGVRCYVLQGIVDYNSYSREQHVGGLDDLSSHMESLRAACRQHDIDLVFSIPARMAGEEARSRASTDRFFDVAGRDPSQSRQCMLPWELPYIDKDGKVFPCCYAGAEDQAQLGDLRESAFEQIWLGEPYARFRQSLLDGRSLAPICKGCTAAPIGRHPLQDFRAVLPQGGLEISDHRVRLKVRNTGTRTWTQGSALRIGTTAPRDGTSDLWHPSWPSVNRTCSFLEGHVAPGEAATFEFSINPAHRPTRQEFQLVADGVCWIPNTRFTVALSRRRSVRRQILGVVRSCRRRSGRR